MSRAWFVVGNYEPLRIFTLKLGLSMNTCLWAWRAHIILRCLCVRVYQLALTKALLHWTVIILEPRLSSPSLGPPQLRQKNILGEKSATQTFVSSERTSLDSFSSKSERSEKWMKLGWKKNWRFFFVAINEKTFVVRWMNKSSSKDVLCWDELRLTDRKLWPF